jgi:tetratricopeptide (TPR) repeat protein
VSGDRAASVDRLFDAAVDTYERGDPARALEMVEELLRAHPNHLAALFMAGSLSLAAGRPSHALAALETLLRQRPQDGEALHLLGSACFQLGRWPEAVTAYRAARRSGRTTPDLLNNLALALKETGDVEGAVLAYREALDLNPADPAVHNNLGTALNRLHDHAGAIAAYRRALELEPGNADVWANLATICEHANMEEETEQAVARGLEADPQHENLHLLAARCARRRGDFAGAAAGLERRRAATPPVSAGIHRVMEYELGRCYDLLGDYDRAFRHYTEANRMTAMLWPDLRAGADAFLEDLRDRLVASTPAMLRTWPASPPEQRRSPVFLVSFPRSGTTLMDTILGAHPGVAVLEEEPPLDLLVNERLRALPEGYPRCVAGLSSAAIVELRAAYWRAVDDILGDSATDLMVVDKNPFYSTHAGLIQLLFPGAKFIFALRHPCDVVLSCFMQAFGRNPALENFRDLTTAALAYQRVMDLWLCYRENLDLTVHDLRYESLVADKDREIRALLDFLGLEWQDAMQDHTQHAKKRGRIYTPSYHQVIQPIYSASVDRWKLYARHYGPALETLRPYVERFGYSLD